MLLQRCRSAEANQTLHDLWWSLGLVHYICIFGGSCSLTEFCLLQNSLCVQVLRSSLAALLHATWAAPVSHTLLPGTTNEIMELSQRVPPIFGWAAITLGIGPHSNFLGLFCVVVHLFWLNVCFCCVRFSFSISSQEAWGTSLKWPILSWVRCKTLTQSINHWLLGMDVAPLMSSVLCQVTSKMPVPLRTENVRLSAVHKDCGCVVATVHRAAFNRCDN